MTDMGLCVIGVGIAMAGFLIYLGLCALGERIQEAFESLDDDAEYER